MPKSLANGRIKLSIMATKPVNPASVTLAEWNAGIDAACSILDSDFKLGPVASEKVAEKALCQEGNSNALGASNFEGLITAFRYFTSGGASETTADAVFQALKLKGSRVWIGKRFTSKKSTEAIATADEIEVYEVITDNAMDGSLTGYIKKTVPLEVQDAWLNGTVVAA